MALPGQEYTCTSVIASSCTYGPFSTPIQPDPARVVEEHALRRKMLHDMRRRTRALKRRAIASTALLCDVPEIL